MRIYEAQIVYILLSQGESHAISRPQEIARYLEGVFDSHPQQEQFVVIPLDSKLHPIGRFTVAIGTVDSVCIEPREAFRAAILAGAKSIVMSHNHPSGDPTPSKSDTFITKKFRDAGEVLSIRLVDHIIIGERAKDPAQVGYYSFREHGLI